MSLLPEFVAEWARARDRGADARSCLLGPGSRRTPQEQDNRGNAGKVARAARCHLVKQEGGYPSRRYNQWRSVMITKIPALIAAGLILASASVASAAVSHRGHDRVTQDSSVYAEPSVDSYGGYSLDPETRRLERLADKYYGWSEYIH